MHKKYIMNELKHEIYCKWLGGKKIVIHAPTGCGKTTFVLEAFLPYCKTMGKKVLILCNRRLLREQYQNDLANQYIRYEELKEIVDVKTYQEMASELIPRRNLDHMLDEYDVVIFDEVHYFYSDSDFNAHGTYCLFQALIRAGYFKSMIFITATLDEVFPILKKTINKCHNRLLKDNSRIDMEKYRFTEDVCDFSSWGDYSRFKCYFLPDMESLCAEIAASEKKTIVFIDDRRIAEAFKKKLLETKKVKENQIFLLNAQILDENMKDINIRMLSTSHKVRPKILITTSVLDNGVSIHDENVGNVVIATESRISFLQMIGRVRAEKTENCNLYIFPRELSYYEKRVTQYEEKIKNFENLNRIFSLEDEYELKKRGWFGNDEHAEFLRNALVITHDDIEYYHDPDVPVYTHRGGVKLAINEFSKEKTGNMLLAERRFLQLAYDGMEEVAKAQIAWIGKEKDELVTVKSSYLEMRQAQLREMLLKVKNYTKEELTDFKKILSSEFRKDLLSGVVFKDGSFSKEKLDTICNEYELILEITMGSDNKNRYSIVEKKMV